MWYCHLLNKFVIGKQSDIHSAATTSSLNPCIVARQGLNRGQFTIFWAATTHRFIDVLPRSPCVLGNQWTRSVCGKIYGTQEFLPRLPERTCLAQLPLVMKDTRDPLRGLNVFLSLMCELQLASSTVMKTCLHMLVLRCCIYRLKGEIKIYKFMKILQRWFITDTHDTSTCLRCAYHRASLAWLRELLDVLFVASTFSFTFPFCHNFLQLSSALVAISRWILRVW